MAGVAHFTLMGALGGLTYAVLWARTWREVFKWRLLRHVIVGMIIGYVYFFLHTEHGLPDSVAAFVSGYAGVDFIEAIVMRIGGFKPKTPSS